MAIHALPVEDAADAQPATGAAGAADLLAPASLAERAYLQLRDRLVMLDIRPGEPINDLALARDLGVGRTPVREALKRLETDHLVVSYSRRGTFATGVDVTELGAVADLRQQLEPHAARRAAESASPAARAQMRTSAERVRDLEPGGRDHTGLIREDVAVHRMVYAATGNPHLEDVLIRYDNLATRIWCLVIDKVPGLSEHVREHHHLLEAIADGDADRAAGLALEHVSGFHTAVRQVL